MDSTELHYLTYDPDAIWSEMMIAYVKAGGDILYPGDEKEMLLRSVLADIVQVFAGVDNALRMWTLRYAVGPYLDEYGKGKKCSRIEASAARATVTITTNETGKEDVLPAGTAMTCDGELYYLLTEDLTLTGYRQTVTVDVIAESAGSAGNRLAAGTQMVLAVTNTGVNSIIVATAASGGNEREKDEAYRERIRTYGLTGNTTGPVQQYEAATKGVSSAIVDAKALNLGAGKVGIYLILSTDEGKEEIQQDVLKALSEKTVRPLTDHVSVSLATDIPYMLEVHYETDRSSAAGSAVAQAVKEYQEWQDSTIGLAFNPDRLMAAVYQAGATRVTWGPKSSFNGGSHITYTEIGKSERCKGTITLTASVK